MNTTFVQFCDYLYLAQLNAGDFSTMEILYILVAIPHSGKAWWGECLANLLFSSVWQKKSLANEYISQMVINCNYYFGWFSLANCRRFAKFVKLSIRQTFPLYGI